jgi:hypothetical protein
MAILLPAAFLLTPLSTLIQKRKLNFKLEWRGELYHTHPTTAIYKGRGLWCHVPTPYVSSTQHGYWLKTREFNTLTRYMSGHRSITCLSKALLLQCCFSSATTKKNNNSLLFTIFYSERSETRCFTVIFFTLLGRSDVVRSDCNLVENISFLSKLMLVYWGVQI